MRKLVAYSLVLSLLVMQSLVSIPGIVSSQTVNEYRSIDGSGNNLANPTWGQAHTPLLRTTTVRYSDNVGIPDTTDRPSPREVSNAVVATAIEPIENDRNLSDYVWAWGQFLDHDLSLSATSSAEPFPVIVPSGDPYFDPLATGTKIIPLSRSTYDPLSGTGGLPRQQMNRLTAYIDASQVYGSDPAVAANLRTFQSGKLKTSSGNLLPLQGGRFLAGDTRVNEQPTLMSLQTLFVREHNRLADEIQTANPDLADEEIYQRARRMVGAYLQAVTYNEFLPALLGNAAIGPYEGYDESVNAGIENAFSSAGFRIGHTMITSMLLRMNEDGTTIPEGNLSLMAAFGNVNSVITTGIDPVLRGIGTQRMQEVDVHIINALRNFLFGAPGSGGMDLSSLNIQRGRDHGLPGYNQLRRDYGLASRTDFSEISSNVTVNESLRAVYDDDIEAIDPWIGALAEDHLPNSSVGELHMRMMIEQFERTRHGDRFWYERVMSPAEVEEVRNTTLSDIIERNTEIEHMQRNVFFVASRPYVTGADTSVDIALPEVIRQGSALTATVTIRNDGPSTASGIVMRLTLPEGINLAASGSLVNCAQSDRLVTCGGGMLDDGEERTILVPLLTDGGPTCSENATIFASVSSDHEDSDLLDNEDSSFTFVGCPNEDEADLRLELSAAASLRRGSQLPYVLTLENAGPAATPDVSVMLPVPAGLTFLPDVGTPECTLTGGTIVECAGFGLESGETRSFTVLMDVPPTHACPTDLTASAVAMFGGDDWFLPNNADSVTTAIECEPMADVGVSMTGPSSVERGDNATYRVNASNAGPSFAGLATVSIPLPVGFTFDESTSTQGCSQNGADVECQVSDFGADTSRTVDVTFTVGSAECGTTTDLLASIDATEVDPNPGNNVSQTVVTDVTCEAETPTGNSSDGSDESDDTEQRTSTHSHLGHGTTEAAMVMSFLMKSHGLNADDGEITHRGHFVFAGTTDEIFALQSDDEAPEAPDQPFTEAETNVICGMRKFLQQEVRRHRSMELEDWVIGKLSGFLERHTLDIRLAMADETFCE